MHHKCVVLLSTDLTDEDKAFQAKQKEEKKKLEELKKSLGDKGFVKTKVSGKK